VEENLRELCVARCLSIPNNQAPQSIIGSRFDMDASGRSEERGDENGEAGRKNRVFHEQQRLMLCGVHCLNNLFCNDSAECMSSSSPLFTQVMQVLRFRDSF
jgi:hypothetical protein